MAGSLRERVPAASVRRVRLLRVDLRAHRVEREGLGGVNIPHVKGSTGQFHEKIGASFLSHSTTPIARMQLFPV